MGSLGAHMGYLGSYMGPWGPGIGICIGPMNFLWNFGWTNGMLLYCRTQTNNFRFGYLVFVICIWPNGAHGSNKLVNMIKKWFVSFCFCGSSWLVNGDGCDGWIDRWMDKKQCFAQVFAFFVFLGGLTPTQWALLKLAGRYNSKNVCTISVAQTVWCMWPIIKH